MRPRSQIGKLGRNFLRFRTLATLKNAIIDSVLFVNFVKKAITSSSFCLKLVKKSQWGVGSRNAVLPFKSGKQKPKIFSIAQQIISNSTGVLDENYYKQKIHQQNNIAGSFML